jgi:hypothetical protein
VKRLVTWEQWWPLWAYGSLSDYGTYFPCQKECETIAEARGFAAGLKNDSQVRNVRVRSAP